MKGSQVGTIAMDVLFALLWEMKGGRAKKEYDT
jgi:hypothetical protein